MAVDADDEAEADALDIAVLLPFVPTATPLDSEEVAGLVFPPEAADCFPATSDEVVAAAASFFRGSVAVDLSC